MCSLRRMLKDNPPNSCEDGSTGNHQCEHGHWEGWPFGVAIRMLAEASASHVRVLVPKARLLFRLPASAASGRQQAKWLDSSNPCGRPRLGSQMLDSAWYNPAVVAFVN